MQVFQQILLTRLNKYIMLVIIIKHNIHLLPCLLFCETFGLFNSSMYMYTVSVRFLQFLSKPPLPVFFRGPTTARP